MAACLPMTSPETNIEDRLLEILRQEADACASLLAWAREAQRALLAMDPDQLAQASRQQLKALATLHRIELNRKALLMTWADSHKMAYSTVTVTDVAGRVESPLADTLLCLTQSVIEQLVELSLVNECNRALVRSDLELHRALWQRLMSDQTPGALYGPVGHFSGEQSSGYLVERRA